MWPDDTNFFLFQLFLPHSQGDMAHTSWLEIRLFSSDCYLDVWNLLTRTQRTFCNISHRIMSKKWRIVLRANKCIRQDNNIKEKRHEINRPLTTGCPCVGIWWGLIQQYFPIVIFRVFIQTAIWREIWTKFHDHEISCFFSWEAIQKLVSSSQLRAIPELWISMKVHIRTAKAF